MRSSPPPPPLLCSPLLLADRPSILVGPARVISLSLSIATDADGSRIAAAAASFLAFLDLQVARCYYFGPPPAMASNGIAPRGKLVQRARRALPFSF